MNKKTPFPWHYYIRTVRSRIFYVIATALLTYVLTQSYQQDILFKVTILIMLMIAISFIHSFFRIIPLRNVLSKVENIQLQLPHNKQLNVIYKKDEWTLLEEMLNLTEHYMLKQRQWIDDQNEQSKTIIETIPDAIVVIDKFENCKIFNSHFKSKFLKVDSKIINNVKVFKIFDDELVQSFKKVINEDQCISRPAFYFPNTNEFFDIAISPVHNSNMEVTGALGIFHNVTSSKLTEKMRVDFVANVSHEIRTPLTSIKGYTQLLQAYGDKIDDDIKPILNKIDTNTNRLKDLFDNLLKLSVIESKYELNFVKLDIVKMLKVIEQNMKAKYLGHNIKISTFYEIDFIKADEKLIEQVFSNLIDNAIKYNNEDNALIQIHVSKLESYYQIKICDNGPGIRAKEVDRIFERFYRVQGGGTQKVEGSGLGLSIVKHIVNKHQGSIRVESKLDHGSCFTIQLPS